MGKHTMLMDQQTQQSKDGNSPQTDIWTTQFLLNSQQDFLYSQNYLKLTQKNKTTRIAKTILKKKIKWILFWFQDLLGKEKKPQSKSHTVQ